jgi:hypothetical protein
VAPQIDRTEAARREIDHFFCIVRATEPEPGGVADFAVEIMHTASQSMARRGTRGGVTTPFPAGDGIDPQSRMQ